MGAACAHRAHPPTRPRAVTLSVVQHSECAGILYSTNPHPTPLEFLLFHGQGLHHRILGIHVDPAGFRCDRIWLCHPRHLAVAERRPKSSRSHLFQANHAFRCSRRRYSHIRDLLHGGSNPLGQGPRSLGPCVAISLERHMGRSVVDGILCVRPLMCYIHQRSRQCFSSSSLQHRTRYTRHGWDGCPASSTFPDADLTSHGIPPPRHSTVRVTFLHASAVLSSASHVFLQ